LFSLLPRGFPKKNGVRGTITSGLERNVSHLVIRLESCFPLAKTPRSPRVLLRIPAGLDQTHGERHRIRDFSAYVVLIHSLRSLRLCEILFCNLYSLLNHYIALISLFEKVHFSIFVMIHWTGQPLSAIV
jgi:hypothetical protein